MKKQQSLRDLHEQWERGVARAVEDANLVEELTSFQLDNAAGLQVQAGVKSGSWTSVENFFTTPQQTAQACQHIQTGYACGR